MCRGQMVFFGGKSVVGFYRNEQRSSNVVVELHLIRRPMVTIIPWQKKNKKNHNFRSQRSTGKINENYQGNYREAQRGLFYC